MYISDYPNELTKRLLAEGYTPDRLPDGVRWGSGNAEYTRETIARRVYETPCGLLVRGVDIGTGYMSYGGIDYTHENANPVICCPYIPTKRDCELRDKRLPPHSTMPTVCSLHLTDRPYDESVSVHHVYDDQMEMDGERERAARAALAAEVRRQGYGYCPQHAVWHREEQSAVYFYDYDPWNCNHCQRPKCLRCGMEDGLKRGNVLADIHIWQTRRDGSLLDGEVSETLLRGHQVLDNPARMAVCQMMATIGADWVERRILSRYSNELYFEKHHWKDGRFRIQVENIRVKASGKKDKQDLLADMQAARDGITVIHESEQTKKAAEAKKERTIAAKEKKTSKLIDRVATGNATPYQIDRFCKMANKDSHLRNQLAKRKKELSVQAKQPTQLTMDGLMPKNEGGETK